MLLKEQSNYLTFITYYAILKLLFILKSEVNMTQMQLLFLMNIFHFVQLERKINRDADYFDARLHHCRFNDYTYV